MFSNAREWHHTASRETRQAETSDHSFSPEAQEDHTLAYPCQSSPEHPIFYYSNHLLMAFYTYSSDRSKKSTQLFLLVF